MKKIIYLDVYKKFSRKEKKKYSVYFTIWECNSCGTSFQVEKGLGGFKSFRCPSCSKEYDVHFRHYNGIDKSYANYISKRFPIDTGKQGTGMTHVF